VSSGSGEGQLDIMEYAKTEREEGRAEDRKPGSKEEKHVLASRSLL